MTSLNVILPDSGFRCRQCGVCCKSSPPDISFREQEKIEAKGFAGFLEDPNDFSNRAIRRKRDGSCVFFTEENTCQIHDVKPSICRLEPFVIKDIDFKGNRILLALNSLAVKNCKGLCRGKMDASEDITRAAQTIVEDSMEIIAAKMGLPVGDRRVVSLTRKLLCL
ncbi:YkgJ family cysteine cluster protein [Candidatus Bathyarchaeota archaeon]|nr:YkgJ family cysteine cluster protein [Candidatus Bathyarchaeota archaeon]